MSGDDVKRKIFFIYRRVFMKKLFLVFNLLLLFVFSVVSEGNYDEDLGILDLQNKMDSGRPMRDYKPIETFYYEYIGSVDTNGKSVNRSLKGSYITFMSNTMDKEESIGSKQGGSR
jgi:hypothetical protein